MEPFPWTYAEQESLLHGPQMKWVEAECDYDPSSPYVHVCEHYGHQEWSYYIHGKEVTLDEWEDYERSA